MTFTRVLTRALLVGATSLTVGLSGAAVATAGGVDPIHHTFTPATQKAIESSKSRCPERVIIVARGTAQNDPADLKPTKYSPNSPYTSNGYEAPNVRLLLQQAEARHKARTGQSLLENTLVLGVDSHYYQAEPSLPTVSDEPDVEEIITLLKDNPPHQLAGNAVGGMALSILRGIPGAYHFIQDYEKATGCSPQYILIGYSQGAIVLAPQEIWLAQRKQLDGVLYMGNPMQPLPQHSAFPTGTHKRLNYCVKDDVFCDPSPQAVARAISEDGGPHAGYFIDKNPGDAHVLDTLATYIDDGGDYARQTPPQ
ncbi:hypothetical protein [Corynebacterium anserum]|uniref:Cutinase family protein n=1 Tax=Corynebacterium anserum TaxID=2684406 RepID=A0A7G7YPU2_9CORY|nr:hypothetical protein [Corynebacterium anserum]MBC2682158.1 hypothetical protein [Corynebacterium anserum]QNH96512.1 cutinase family protein [Corynebacterium anserum]